MIDDSLNAWFQANNHPFFTRFLLVITHWHSTLGVLLMSAALGLWLARRGMVWWLLSLFVAVPGGMLLNFGIKHLAQRERPQWDDPLLTLASYSYSFPSGHTAGATLFYGFLAVLLLALVEHRAWRRAIVTAAVVMVLLVGLSRVYLGVHHFSDVLAAMVVASIWLALCLNGARALWRRFGSGPA